jgi:hypothetical protein
VLFRSWLGCLRARTLAPLLPRLRAPGTAPAAPRLDGA